MRIYFFRYEHEPLPGVRCQGSLLRIQFDGHRIGYCDVHPWVQYGESHIDEQLSSLRSGRLTPLLAKSLFFAERDAEARGQARNLLHGLDLANSHALVDPFATKQWEQLVQDGYQCLKVKVVAKVAANPSIIENFPPSIRLRLDFSGRFSFAEFKSWWGALPPTVQKMIEMVEDPWNGIGESFEKPACYADWLLNQSWLGRVFKPARTFSFEEHHVRRYQKVIFTHGLDHPLGQAAALWEAAKFYKTYPSLRQTGGFSKVPGFDEYYERWNFTHPRRPPPPGTGFGFDDLLTKLRWEPLL